MGTIAVAYSVIVYVIFFGSFLYAVGFVGNFIVPKGIDAGVAAQPVAAIAVNLLLLGLFAVQHSVMARPAFKRWWTRFVPVAMERSTYVLLSSLLLLLIFWQWRPLPGVVWSVEHPAGQMVLWALFWAGWGLVLTSTFLINHFDLFGLRQAWLHWRGREYTHLRFKTTGLYGLVRHPLMLGFLIAFWATPEMTQGHLLFSAATTGYIVIGTLLEERDLVHYFGAEYAQYRQRVAMLVPWLKR